MADRALSSASARTRCAIYTRKSHEDGMEQDFNSLDAQREACEAYILSQKSEGWIYLPEMYDDGGISGATLERPALKRLMTAIESGAVDTVMVYKVDRLTRSLGDFAKIVEVFDRQGVSFVSVTQQFNTTTSMGRLTLNMLLSFAQFEREVTGERIRDKIAASKKKGLWMGGLPPLGYDVDDRKLVVNHAEVDTVRHIFKRYVDLGSVRTLQAELERDGVLSKRRLDRFGRQTGGKPLARGALYHMLQNRLYRGEIVHKDQSYPGAHDEIIGQDLWDAVQQKLEANRQERKTGSNAAEPSLLAGLLEDDAGTPMTPSHANKKGRRYRYYISRETGRWRVPAGDLEQLVTKRICGFLASEAELFGAIESVIRDADDRAAILQAAALLSKEWNRLERLKVRNILITLVERIVLCPERLEVRLRQENLIAILIESTALLVGRETVRKMDRVETATITLSVPATLKRAGIETRLIIDGTDDDSRRQSDHSLQRLIAQGYQYRELVLEGGRPIAELADEVGVGRSYFARVLRLGFLAPDAIKAILADKHPLELTAKKLAEDTHLLMAWEEQKTSLGLR